MLDDSFDVPTCMAQDIGILVSVVAYRKVTEPHCEQSDGETTHDVDSSYPSLSHIIGFPLADSFAFESVGHAYKDS